MTSKPKLSPLSSSINQEKKLIEPTASIVAFFTEAKLTTLRVGRIRDDFETDTFGSEITIWSRDDDKTIFVDQNNGAVEFDSFSLDVYASGENLWVHLNQEQSEDQSALVRCKYIVDSPELDVAVQKFLSQCMPNEPLLIAALFNAFKTAIKSEPDYDEIEGALLENCDTLGLEGVDGGDILTLTDEWDSDHFAGGLFLDVGYSEGISFTAQEDGAVTLPDDFDLDNQYRTKMAFVIGKNPN